MFATQVLSETLSDDDSKEEIGSEIVGYLIVNEKTYEVRKGETKIGRDSSMCSIVLENFTVSKVHAIIESEGINDTFIYDVGSTNQTKIGKKVLKPHCRYKLDNQSILTLGNITAKFLVFPDKSSNSENSNHIDDLGNIFEVATQVTKTNSSKICVFEKLPENFKVPTIVLPAHLKESPESSKNIFDQVTQCKIDSQKETSNAMFCGSLLENSEIFSLSTQCQLYETQAQENKCEEKLNNNDNNKNDETDKIKSLLNDGQDDVLCIFMSMHSPKVQTNKESIEGVKIKTEVKDISEIWDLPTEIESVTNEKSVIENKIEQIDLINKDFNEGFYDKSLCKPSITSTPLICRNKSTHLCEVSKNSEDCTQLLKEDFIKTQEFNAENKKSVNICENMKNLCESEEIQPYLGGTSNDLSNTDQKNNEEDMILTQIFEVPQIQKTKITSNVVLESENINEFEDFMPTQVYDVDKEKVQEEISTKPKTFHQDINMNPDVHHLDESLYSAQRDNQDDFITTQTFKYTADHRNNAKNLESDSRDVDEDFMATQPVEIPANNTKIVKNFRESTFKSSFRESSPDLMGFEDTWKDSEDFISTQLFDICERQTSNAVISKSSAQNDLSISSRFKKENIHNVIPKTKEPVTVESSGDETESDLETILDLNEERKTEEGIRKPSKTEVESENSKPQISDPQENDSNSSFIFEMGRENEKWGNPNEESNSISLNEEQRVVAQLSDSDETDCEEIAVVNLRHSIKQEFLGKIKFEESQVLTLTLPDNCAENVSESNDCMTDRESPRFEIGIEDASEKFPSPCISNAQNVETSNRALEYDSGKMEDYQVPFKIKKSEVGITKSGGDPAVSNSGREAFSPLKRSLNLNGRDVVPTKKSKTDVIDSVPKSSEKQFLKLVQAHDIAQIQPSRTRNSLKMLTTENKPNKSDIGVTNEYPYSRRKTSPIKADIKKPNGYITSFLTTKKVVTKRTSCRRRMKETSPKENKLESESIERSSRILRSSIKNAASSILVERSAKNIPIRKSRRISRSKSEEYFTNSCVNVVFTGFGCESLDKIISELGGKKTHDFSGGEVVVADKIRRTVKFLCAIGLGLPITSPKWLLSCKRAQMFLNPWNFILKDEESEEKFNFELKASLEKSKKVKLLHGFSIFATKNTKPPVKDLLAIVECCGGTPLFHPPDVWPKRTIIVSCLEDKQYWPMPKSRNIKIVHYEFILGGVLRQKIDFNTYRLR